MPRLRRKELIKLAAEKKAEEDRQAWLNALVAGRWIQPQKRSINEALYPTTRSDYVAPETGLSEEEAIERAWKIIKADKRERGKRKKEKEKT